MARTYSEDRLRGKEPGPFSWRCAAHPWLAQSLPSHHRPDKSFPRLRVSRYSRSVTSPYGPLAPAVAPAVRGGVTGRQWMVAHHSAPVTGYAPVQS
jgi:hypothetical protein